MKKKVLMLNLFLLLLVIFGLVLAVETRAQNLGWDKAGTAAGSKGAGYSGATDEKSFSGIAGAAIQAVLSLLGVIFLILMVYAGYIWLMARGEEAEVEKAQKIIMAAVIGLVIVVGAYSITTFVVPRILNKAGGSGAAADIGAPKVECCWNCEVFTCDKQPMNDKDCTAKGWDYKGLVPAEECQ